MRNSFRKDIPAFAVIAALYLLIDLFGAAACPFRFLFGLSCAGCGMTRAWKALILSGDPAAAMAFHPLFWLVIPAGLLILLRNRIPEKIGKILWWIIIGLMLIVYLLRMMDPNDAVVVFQPEKGIILKGLHFFERISGA